MGPKMVVKYEKCAFSEFNIFPGHGMRFIRRDGTPLFLINAKAKSMVNQRKKPAKLRWTIRWRILNKKGLDSNIAKKRARRAVKAQRAVVGMSLEEIKKKKLQKPEFRSAQREAALREVKERNKKAKEVKKAAAVKAMTKDNKAKTSKHAGGGGKKGGSQR